MDAIPQHEVGLFPDETLNPHLLKKAFFKENFQGFFFIFPESLVLLLLLEVDLVLPSDMAVGTLQRAPL